MALRLIPKVFPTTLSTVSHFSASRASRVHGAFITVWRGTYRHSSTTADDSREVSKVNNDVVNPEFINRNPRNLERMGIARKSKGWMFQYPSKAFYHRLRFESTNRHTMGWVEHCSGRTVVIASTNEFSIGKHLYSFIDVSAAENVGRILAERCQKSGITVMSNLEPEHGNKSEKYLAFYDAIVDAGISLEEPDEVLPHYTPGINYDDQWEVQDLTRRQHKARRNPRRTVFKYGEKKKNIKVKKYRD